VRANLVECGSGACVREGRALLTLILTSRMSSDSPPHRAAGVAVLRLPKQPSLATLEKFVTHLIAMLDAESIAGRVALETGFG